jgi:D-serine deaminase-like pyridoxal phosphate-dependent protein
MTAQSWFTIDNIDTIDSPALALYADRIEQNIQTLVNSIDDVNRLRPHIKTHKSGEVSKMMLAAEIKKFKCATIAEAEMLATVGAPDVLLSYQPVGPKANRLAELTKKYANTKFSCLIDNLSSAQHLSAVFSSQSISIEVYIDLNVGMNRTGIIPVDALKLYEECKSLNGITVVGLHAYDGHLRDTDFVIRTKRCDEAFSKVESLQKTILEKDGKKLTIVAGGTPTYCIHSKRKEIECSPGTYIYWDKGYEQILTEQHYLFAALVITRIISKPTEDTICIDLGHKAIASENPLANRVYFLNATDLEPTGHSEEHMTFKTSAGNSYQVGDVLYGVPYHVCPTIALHDEACVVRNHKVAERWKTVSRNRKITI